jgi:hypothetical protein
MDWLKLFFNDWMFVSFGLVLSYWMFVAFGVVLSYMVVQLVRKIFSEIDEEMWENNYARKKLIVRNK